MEIFSSGNKINVANMDTNMLECILFARKIDYDAVRAKHRFLECNMSGILLFSLHTVSGKRRSHFTHITAPNRILASDMKKTKIILDLFISILHKTCAPRQFTAIVVFQYIC